MAGTVLIHRQMSHVAGPEESSSALKYTQITLVAYTSVQEKGVGMNLTGR